MGLHTFFANYTFFRGFLLSFLIFLCGGLSDVFSQTLLGTVKNSSNNPIQNVNIIAEPIHNGNNLKFAITDYLGRYQLLLDKKIEYKITISHISYHTTEFPIYVDFSKKEHHFVLKQKEELLNEIIIEYNPKPIFVKKDTITYVVDFFKDGTEFKMIDILEKLPGIEVENDGAIKMQGKEVSKVLVENEPFFGGSTKLAIENIPADALEKIEVIDNFNEVDFLKQVSDSKEMILNVKLKEEKKKFIFGDVELGAEIANSNNFYLLQAALFLYNEKANFNYIGNLNSIGKRSMSFKDIMRFQNNKNSFIRNNKYNNNISGLSRGSTDVLKNRTQFSALNLNFKVNPKLRVESYGIFSDIFNVKKQENNVQYLKSNSFLSEKRTFEENSGELLALGNVKLHYIPKINSRIIYNGQFQFASPKSNNVLESERKDQLKELENIKKANNKKQNQFFEWHKKFNSKNITTLVINQSYKNKTIQNNWLSNASFLDEYITYRLDNRFNIKQIKNIESNNVDFLIKHYWIVHNLHHIYTNIGNNLNITNIKTLEEQFLSDKNRRSLFKNYGFKNQIKYSLNNFYIGLEYKFKLKRWENKLSLYANYYSLISKQKNNNIIKTTLIEPKWNSNYEFNPTENIELEYEFSNEFPAPNKLFEQYTVLSYNTVFRGNPLLKNEKFHNLTLNYSKHNLYKGLSLYANTTLNKKTKSIRNKIKLTGIDNFITPEMISTPELNFRFSGMIEKQIHKFKVSFRPSFRWSEYLQTVNNVRVLNRRSNKNITFRIRTADKKLPRLGISYKKFFGKFNGLSNSLVTSDNIKFNANITLFKNLSFTGSYELIYAKNQNNKLVNYQLADATVVYKKRSNPLSFEISAQNFLNNNKKTINNFYDYLILNKTTYTLPKIIMLSIKYKI